MTSKSKLPQAEAERDVELMEVGVCGVRVRRGVVVDVGAKAVAAVISVDAMKNLILCRYSFGVWSDLYSWCASCWGWQ